MRKIVGKVTEEEKKEILSIYERKNGLQELAKVLRADDNELYERIINDLGETMTRFQKWWDTMGEKYQWESAPNGDWSINFETCEITLITE